MVRHRCSQQFTEKKLKMGGRRPALPSQGSNLVMNLGFSHQVDIPMQDCTMVADAATSLLPVSIWQKVDQYALPDRAKPPEPYKGRASATRAKVVKAQRTE